jgi:hypothetical protein
LNSSRALGQDVADQRSPIKASTKHPNNFVICSNIVLRTGHHNPIQLVDNRVNDVLCKTSRNQVQHMLGDEGGLCSIYLPLPFTYTHGFVSFFMLRNEVAEVG